MAHDFTFLRKMSSPYMQVVGREQEIDFLLDTLYKSRMRNIVLTGDAGIGKTELVREVAKRAKKMGPNWTFYELDLANLLSDTAYRGELEEKFDEDFRKLSNEDSVVLFCDEAHLLSSAGETQGEKNSMTVGNLLKPYLSNGQITLWGATTKEEYRESIYKDPALRRRLPEYEVAGLKEEDMCQAYMNFAKKIGTSLTLTQAQNVLSKEKTLEAGIERIDREWAHIKRQIVHDAQK